MNDLLLLIRNIEIALSNDLSNNEMLIDVLTLISRMNFEHVSMKEKRIIEYYVNKINEILMRYKIQGVVGYYTIPTEEFNEIHDHLKLMCDKLFLITTVENSVC
jgi:hypothetical protein